jgi:hypothetical protein
MRNLNPRSAKSGGARWIVAGACVAACDVQVGSRRK